MKKIVIACDSFKESMNAIEACDSIEKGLKRCKIPCHIEKIPLADGGEGTSDILRFQRNCHKVTINIQNPLSQNISCHYWIEDNQKTAYIDVAMACGIELLSPEQRNPIQATSYGLGQLIHDAVLHGVKQILIGLGGSCTNDGGIGLLRALGAKFYQKDGTECLNIRQLSKLDYFDISNTREILKGVRIIGLYDVDNVLLGKGGATQVFGPQKGANASQIHILEACLSRWNEVVQEQENRNIAKYVGAGAAGGTCRQDGSRRGSP